MKLKKAIRQLTIIATPMILGQIGQTLIGAGDVYVASLYSTQLVASIGVANGIFMPVLIIGLGLMMGVSPLLANHRGSGIETKGYLVSFIVYALVVGLGLMLVLLGLTRYVDNFGLDPALVPSIKLYLSWIAWTIPFSLIFQGVKEYLQSFENVMFPNMLSIAAVFVNIVTNYFLVFGFGDVTGLGELGLPIASIIIRILLAIAIVLYAIPKEKWGRVSWTLNKEVAIFSYPIAIAFFLEVLAFCMVSILSGKLGVVSAAANNIILTLGSALFMVPMSVASAVAVKVGNALGRLDQSEVAIYMRAALSLTLTYSIFSSSILAFLPQELMSLFTDDVAVINLGVKVCYVAAIFQLVDCSQATFSGILRGLKETRSPSIMMFIAFWLLGIPYGIYLAFYRNYDIMGLWIGLALGLGIASVGLYFLVRRRFVKLFPN